MNSENAAENIQCLHELFERQADLLPESIALIRGDLRLTYEELDSRANQLAHYLRLYGAAPGKFVGLFLEKSEHPIIAILACLKAGAAYVPIDPAYPSDRIHHIEEESELILLLTETALLERAGSLFRCRSIALDASAKEVAAQPTRRLPRQETGLAAADLCYVIYTSGTTGRPKGVMAEHRNAVKYTLAFNEVCGTSVDDRIYQGFSLGFDGSVEEIWMAYSNGSALVVGDRETPRFGNELGQFLVRNGVTYFSTVPTLLSTLTEPVPSLRLLIVSGEICPAELVQRWARPGLRMLNVYGPTEATVNTTAAECVPGKAITIGRPLPGYDLFILDPQMRPVAYGETGELYVGGETLARGYLKRPDLTAERFIRLPESVGEKGLRLYRTGDWVRYNAQGELEFFGRIDSQVKIRGYRVELAEIESVLLEQPRIQSASVKLIERDGLQELAAYIVVSDPETPLDRDEVLSCLEAHVPSYMIPGYLDVVTELPMLSSGKVDRSKLPAPVAPLVRTSREFVEAETELESQVASIWARVLGLPEVSVEDHFFLDLGGHSLLAAQVVTTLRKETRRHITVRDIYDVPTIRGLADRIAARPVALEVSQSASSKAVFESLPRWVRLMTAALQAISIYALFGLIMAPLALIFRAGLSWYDGSISVGIFAARVAAILLLTWPTLLALSIAAKWLLIGRYRAGRYPLWGFYYFRWWLVTRLQALSGAASFAGTPLMPLYFRAMGARVGKNCTLDTSLGSAWDLISIGDETSIGADTQILGYRVENGMLILGSIEIGGRCFVGIHSALGLGSRMEDGAILDDQSLLPDGSVIVADEACRGSPARPAEVELPKAGMARRQVSASRRAVFGLLHFLLIEALAALLFVPALPLFAFWNWAFRVEGIWDGLLAMTISVPVGTLFYALFFALVKRLVLPRIEPGVYPVDSLIYLRKWFSDALMKASRVILLPLYTTLYLPPWLRLMGAKIGRRAELSTVWQFSPELIEVGEESFFADGSIIGGKRFYGGHFQVGINRIGRRSFVGNSAILPVGISLGDESLLGVQSIPPAGMSRTPDRTDWLGSPSFALPHRQKVGGFDDAVTFHPTRKLYLQRAIIDGLRIFIPGFIALSSAVMATIALDELDARLGAGMMFLLAPAVGLALGLYSTLMVVALKRAVMGTFKPEIVPLWSMYVWLNEMLNGAYESVMAPAIAPFLGTPFVASLLRLIGCRIGRHTFIETTLFSEFDLVEVGDYAALNFGAVIQTHLFEDRVMKSSNLKIGDEVSVGNMAVILYDSEIETGATIGPLSLLMKGEKLTSLSRSHGIPTVQVTVEAEEKAPLELHGLMPRGLRRMAPMKMPETVEAGETA